MKNIILYSAVLIFFTSVSHLACSQTKKTTSKVVKTTAIKKPADMITMLQGKWVSLDDKQSFIIFKGYQQIDVYGKEVLDTSAINFYKKCPEHFSAKDAKAKSGTHLAVAMPDGDILCYEIDYLTAKSLHLIYLPRGNMLRYKKL